MSQSHYDCPCMEKCPLHHAMSGSAGPRGVQSHGGLSGAAAHPGAAQRLGGKADVAAREKTALRCARSGQSYSSMSTVMLSVPCCSNSPK